MTEESIRAFVNAVLQKAFTANQIDAAILATMNDLTKFNLLTASSPAEFSKVDGDNTLDLPADFKKVISITPIDGSSVQKAPLLPVLGGFKEYKLWNADNNVNFRSTPEYFVKKADKVFIWPTLNASFTFEMEYYKNITNQNTETIEFGDDFTNAVNYGAAYHRSLFRKLTTYINIWRPIYLEERRTMILMNPTQPAIVGA